MRNTFFIFSLLFLIVNSRSVYASGTVKLVDYLVSSSGLVELLGRNGISGVDAKQVENFVFTSLNSFGNGKKLSKEELKLALSKMPVSAQDASIRKELQLLLDRSDAEIKKEDIVKSINHIIYLANRHGKSVVITCAECVSESLAKNGFKFTVENIKNTNSVKLLNDIIPNNPKDLNTFIASKVKRLRLGDYSKVNPGMVAPYEEKSLALYLAILENGAADNKNLANAIKKLSTKNNTTNIFEASNPNKLWKIFSNDLSSSEISKMNDLLAEVDEVMEKEKLKIEEAFNRVLRKKSEASDELLKKYKGIKSKRCFFK